MDESVAWPASLCLGGFRDVSSAMWGLGSVQQRRHSVQDTPRPPVAVSLLVETNILISTQDALSRHQALSPSP